jgi:hypothetical protein
MSEHATYNIVTDFLTQTKLAKVLIVVDGQKYGMFLPATSDLLDDQEALDTVMMSMVARERRKANDA